MKTKRLVINAMLIAMYVVLSLYCTVNLGIMKLTVDGIPILIGALLLGPVDGLLIGFLGSFLNQMLRFGFTATTLLWVLPAAVRGLLVGWYACRNHFTLSYKKLLFIVIASGILTTAINTGTLLVDAQIYGWTTPAAILTAVPARIATAIATSVLYCMVLPVLLKLLTRAGIRAAVSHT